MFCVLVCALGIGTASGQTRVVPAFDLSVRILADVPVINVEGQVIVPPRNRPVDSVEFDLDRRVREFQVSVIEPSGSSVAATAVRQRNSAVVTLPAPVPANSPITLRFNYSIGENSARSFYVARDGVLFSGESAGWYPRPSSHRRATGRLRFHSPEGVTVVSTGRQLGARDNNGWVRFEVNDPTTFSMASARHEIYTSPGDPTVALHLLTPRSRANERLALIRRILAILVDEFGPYPHPDLEVVEMPNAAMGGAGNGTSLEGFLVISPDVIDRASLLTLAHEITHQWWADSVFAVGQAPVLLAETMANYGGLRALEAILANAPQPRCAGAASRASRQSLAAVAI